MHFLLRVQYCQLRRALQGCQPHLASWVHGLGYKAKRDYVVYWICVYFSGCKCTFLRMHPMAGLSIRMLSSEKFAQSLQSIAKGKARCNCGAWESPCAKEDRAVLYHPQELTQDWLRTCTLRPETVKSIWGNLGSSSLTLILVMIFWIWLQETKMNSGTTSKDKKLLLGKEIINKMKSK